MKCKEYRNNRKRDVEMQSYQPIGIQVETR